MNIRWSIIHNSGRSDLILRLKSQPHGKYDARGGFLSVMFCGIFLFKRKQTTSLLYLEDFLKRSFRIFHSQYFNVIQLYIGN